jgi:hypothetical protein
MAVCFRKDVSGEYLFAGQAVKQESVKRRLNYKKALMQATG